MLTVNVKETSHTLKEKLKELAKQKLTLKVGVLEGEEYTGEYGSKPGLPVAMVAFWNEFGTTDIPARPAFRNAIKKNTKKWAAAIKKLAIANPDDLEGAFSILGDIMSRDIMLSIGENTPPALKPDTVKHKEKLGLAYPSKTLIMSGRYQESIASEVVKE